MPGRAPKRYPGHGMNQEEVRSEHDGNQIVDH